MATRNSSREESVLKKPGLHSDNRLMYSRPSITEQGENPPSLCVCVCVCVWCGVCVCVWCGVCVCAVCKIQSSKIDVTVIIMASDKQPSMKLDEIGLKLILVSSDFVSTSDPQ